MNELIETCGDSNFLSSDEGGAVIQAIEARPFRDTTPVGGEELNIMQPALRLALANAGSTEAQVAVPNEVPGEPPIALNAAGQQVPVSIDMLDQARSYDERIGMVRGFTRDNPTRAALAVRDMIKSDAR